MQEKFTCWIVFLWKIGVPLFYIKIKNPLSVCSSINSCDSRVFQYPEIHSYTHAYIVIYFMNEWDYILIVDTVKIV